MNPDNPDEILSGQFHRDDWQRIALALKETYGDDSGLYQDIRDFILDGDLGTCSLG